MTTEAGPDRLASRLIESGALSSEWESAFSTVLREDFVPDVIWPGRAEGTGQGEAIDRNTDLHAWLDAVYSDISLTTQWDDGTHEGREKGKSPTCSSSQPSMVASMLAGLDVQPGNRVLEIGTGTGWNAALLSEKLGSSKVFSVEVDAHNARAARKHVNEAGYTPTLVVGDGAEGYLPGAPYDRVLVTASITEVPGAWLSQVRPEGLIVAPYATTYGSGAVARLVVQEDGSASGRFVSSAAFMRLRQQRANRKATWVYLSGQKWPADGTKSTTNLSPEDVGDWLEMFAIGLQTRGLFPWAENYDDGSYTLWLRDADVTSWATVDYEPGESEFEVYQSGPRNLWEEVRTAYYWWDSAGRPSYDRFGMTVASGQSAQFWLDSPEHPVPQVDCP